MVIGSIGVAYHSCSEIGIILKHPVMVSYLYIHIKEMNSNIGIKIMRIVRRNSMLKDKWVITTTLAISLVLAGCSTGDAANTESSEGAAASSATDASGTPLIATNVNCLSAFLYRDIEPEGHRLLLPFLTTTDLLRLSVGVEESSDLFDDLDQALKRAHNA